MTYDAQEMSTYDGSPLEVYLFDREGAQFWGYTSADEDQTYLGQSYSAIAIKRGKIEQSQDVIRNSLTITMPTTTEFIQQYISSPPTDRVSLTVRRFHFGDAEVKSIWVGRVVNVSFKEFKAEVRCEPVHSSLKRPTLRRFYQVSCPYLLYGNLCKLDADNFKLVTTLSGVSGLNLVSSDFALVADGYYTGGYIELLDDGAYNKRFITNHVGNTLTINLQLTSAVVGSSVNAYPGCSHNVTVCNSKFDNILNYGGQPWIPTKNPMGGSPIF
jgi:uncharacterized phage protein (TIGR02218 family)